MTASLYGEGVGECSEVSTAQCSEVPGCLPVPMRALGPPHAGSIALPPSPAGNKAGRMTSPLRQPSLSPQLEASPLRPTPLPAVMTEAKHLATMPADTARRMPGRGSDGALGFTASSSSEEVTLLVDFYPESSMSAPLQLQSGEAPEVSNAASAAEGAEGSEGQRRLHTSTPPHLHTSAAVTTAAPASGENAAAPSSVGGPSTSGSKADFELWARTGQSRDKMARCA